MDRNTVLMNLTDVFKPLTGRFYLAQRFGKAKANLLVIALLCAGLLLSLSNSSTFAAGGETASALSQGR